VKAPGTYLAGLGVYLPGIMSARDAVEQGLYDPDDYEWFGWTGAAVAGNMPAPDMAIRAGQQAMERSGHHPSDIDVHVHACGNEQGPEGWSAQHYILRHVMECEVPSYRVWQSCNGGMGALELAASYLLASADRTAALVTGADNVGTPNFNRWSFGLQNGIVGDAASAVLLSRRGGFARLLAIRSASIPDVEEHYRGSEPLFPPSLSVGRPVNIRERLSAFGRDSGEVLASVVTRQGELRTEVALRTLAEAGIDAADVTRVAHIFTGHERYLKPIVDPLGISPDRGLLEFGRTVGHLTVNDQFVGLHHLVETGQVGPGDHVLMLSTGGGVSMTCAVVRIEHRPDWAR
jgi:3-oxoacyl-[acyl-carrier-protein] synthase III